jgi:hypothetical protein
VIYSNLKYDTPKNVDIYDIFPLHLFFYLLQECIFNHSVPGIWYSFLRARVLLCLGCVEWGRHEGEGGQTSNEVDLGRASTANENSVTFQVFASGFKIQKNVFAVSYHRGFSAHISSTKKFALGYSICSANYITNYLDYSNEGHCNS